MEDQKACEDAQDRSTADAVHTAADMLNQAIKYAREVGLTVTLGGGSPSDYVARVTRRTVRHFPKKPS